MKNYNLTSEGSYAPSAFITKGRQRLKQYKDNTVYLNNGDEFEIELFNPTTQKILAVIDLNGNTIGNSGIVLRPGERVFLERYLDISKKFLFETYTVNKNDNNAMKAIEYNGKVNVKFYCEQTFYNFVSYTSGTYNGVDFTYTSSPDFQPHISYNSGDIVNDKKTNVYSSLSFCGSNEPINNIETGRIEKGSNSNQLFTHDHSSFNTWWTWSSDWTILPLSQKNVEYQDIKVYCSKCGTKRKKHNHLFCPNCGTKY